MKTVAILFCVLFFSCASKDFRKKDLLEMDQKLNLVIDNQSAKIDGKDFLELFGINHTATDVKVSFDNSGDLRIIYNDSNFQNPQQKVFKGKFKKKYFEIYFEKKRVVFPPIYWVINVHRLRLAVGKDSTLIAEKHYNHSGMILMLGAGSSYTSYNRYSLINNLKK